MSATAAIERPWHYRLLLSDGSVRVVTMAQIEEMVAADPDGSGEIDLAAYNVVALPRRRRRRCL